MTKEEWQSNLQRVAEDVADDGETVTVTIERAASFDAWEIRVRCVRNGKETQLMMNVGSNLDRLANEMTGIIAQHRPETRYFFKSDRQSVEPETPASMKLCHAHHRHKRRSEARECESGEGLPYVVALGSLEIPAQQERATNR